MPLRDIFQCSQVEAVCLETTEVVTAPGPPSDLCWDDVETSNVELDEEPAVEGTLRNPSIKHLILTRSQFDNNSGCSHSVSAPHLTFGK